MFWLLQGQRDRGPEDAESLPLSSGRLSEHRHGDLGARVPDLVADRGGQVVQQGRLVTTAPLTATDRSGSANVASPG